MNIDRLLIRKASQEFDVANDHLTSALFSADKDERLESVDETIAALSSCLKNLRAAKKELEGISLKMLDTSAGIKLNTGGLS